MQLWRSDFLSTGRRDSRKYFDKGSLEVLRKCAASLLEHTPVHEEFLDSTVQREHRRLGVGVHR